ncbi:Trk system potassium transporter TrkA [Haloferax mediterranei ATCC 33500]|uniref:Potassium transporter TrkA n=1 Tax=Haloferax mediterranei (strain ATCC 33500 / DSM 1411 / JCM 8866 / NBRC 14739 / NCIMB 2177 / R-4) TaxID=523841 RepID=I3R3G4_HALMT|nr:Trk system potassium transporter TrkA [Haloferax mediterranei]AFK18774.1 potassium transporter peripheral membrane component [Haloferax mediterranei ATCC 33500]AHZ21857.1 potassium transporter TrkA [Haloferax mediterranei ATCC 33500]EMA03366.1 potassium transporter peripheral membrane component [Haloferax mediterranei ATCC 33500]MDX5988870.1 Trk system potassium transporter TrkA [Haloferax mediterranei ATCC 33500]QCQ75268.1 Trk system potassium transporter TrkA [Haloferax mediterranei ATCC 
MRVIIIGAGQVGSSIAADLDDTHEVVIIDCDPERVDELNYSLDVLALHGDGTSVETLEEAGVERADMVIASTDNDETNIVTCATAKAISEAFTIARVKNTEYLRTWQRSEKAFGIDFMVCTNLLAAESIVRVVGLPAARDVDSFAGGKVQMAEFEVDAESPVANQTVSEADRFDSLTFAAILRDGEVTIPRGDTVIGPGDRIVVIGSPQSVQGFASSVSPDEPPGTAEEVVIVGGSEIGYHVARLLEERGFKPRLIEQDADRARELAEELPGTIVMESDATDIDFLEREYIGDADLLVSALDSDEKNLLVSLLAARLGVERTVAVIDTTPYVDLFEAVGVDVGVSPREVVAEEITRFTRDGGAENVALIESDKAEVLEIEVDADSVLAGKPIQESIASLPEGVVIGAITRRREFITPRGDTVIKPGDHVVVFVDSCAIDDVSPKL